MGKSSATKKDPVEIWRCGKTISQGLKNVKYFHENLSFNILTIVRSLAVNCENVPMPGDQSDQGIRSSDSQQLERSRCTAIDPAFTAISCEHLPAQEDGFDQFISGFCLEHGKGIEIDMKMAAHSWKLSVDQG
jgi:hypothetical protein